MSALHRSLERQERVSLGSRRPRISFDSANIWRRLQTCETVARAHGWHANDIIIFTDEVREAFSFEEAMAIIEREFDVV